jgi:hypothetical protein
MGRETTEVAAGSTDVVLTVRRGAQMRIRVANWPRDAAGTTATLISEGRVVSPTDRQVSSDGRLAFEGLDASTSYTVWVPPVGPGLVLIAEHLMPGDHEVVVDLVPSKSNRGRMKLPEGAKTAEVWANRQLLFRTVHGKVELDGSFEISGLAPGPWTVHAGVCLGLDSESK